MTTPPSPIPPLPSDRREVAAHTRGPWTNNEYSTFVWSKRGNVCACGDPRAKTTVGYTECEIGAPALSEAVANARLIAAAPDMLAALKEAVEFQNDDTECLASTQSGSGPDGEGEREDCSDRRCYEHGCMVARVNGWRAAIAKATETKS